MDKNATDIEKRPGDIDSLALMDCPVFCVQEEVPLYDDNDTSIFSYWKTTEGLWFTAAEALDWANRHEYRFDYKWRVIGLPARGQLRELLNRYTEGKE